MFLLNRFVTPHFLNGCIEVHVIFDDPDRYEMSPKTVERQRRDKLAKPNVNHVHATFDDSLPPSSKWGGVLKCRECKHNLTSQLGAYMIRLIHPTLLPSTRFFTAGSFREPMRDHAMCVEHGNPNPFIDEKLTCNIEEGDMRVWMHCKYSVGTRKLIFSPDTDTYHVGMGLLEDAQNYLSVMFMCQSIGYVTHTNFCTCRKLVELCSLTTVCQLFHHS